jgi:Xaa-Pro dipeptidase
MSLAFDRQEFDARLARVREQMADQNLDVVLVFGQDQMFYLTGSGRLARRSTGCLPLPGSGCTHYS